jgi:hypothetical protein
MSAGAVPQQRLDDGVLDARLLALGRCAYHSNGELQARPVTRIAISDRRGGRLVP